MDPELTKQQELLKKLHQAALEQKMSPRKSAHFNPDKYLPPHEQAIEDSKNPVEEKPMWLHPDHMKDYNPCAEIPLSFNATHVHVKTGGLYRLLFVGVQEATLQKVAIYQNREGVV